MYLFFPPVLWSIRKKILIYCKALTYYDKNLFNLRKRFELDLKDKKCFILGNGPSLKSDLVKYRDDFTNGILYCVNSFPLTKEFIELRPTFLVFVDPDYTSNSEFLLLEKTSLINRLVSVVKWDLNIMLPKNFEKNNWFLEVERQNEFVRLHYVNSFEFFDSSCFNLFKRGCGHMQFQTVLVKAIFNALNLGFKEIYLFGADISMHEQLSVSDESIVNIKETHFYHEMFYHELKPFWKDSEKIHTFTMFEAFLAFANMFKGFEELEEYSKYLGSKVYNCSSRSFIDAFEKIEY